MPAPVVVIFGQTPVVNSAVRKRLISTVSIQTPGGMLANVIIFRQRYCAVRNDEIRDSGGFCHHFSSFVISMVGVLCFGNIGFFSGSSREDPRPEHGEFHAMLLRHFDETELRRNLVAHCEIVGGSDQISPFGRNDATKGKSSGAPRALSSPGACGSWRWHPTTGEMYAVPRQAHWSSGFEFQRAGRLSCIQPAVTQFEDMIKTIEYLVVVGYGDYSGVLFHRQFSQQIHDDPGAL